MLNLNQSRLLKIISRIDAPNKVRPEEKYSENIDVFFSFKLIMAL